MGNRGELHHEDIEVNEGLTIENEKCSVQRGSEVSDLL